MLLKLEIFSLKLFRFRFFITIPSAFRLETPFEFTRTSLNGKSLLLFFITPFKLESKSK